MAGDRYTVERSATIDTAPERVYGADAPSRVRIEPAFEKPWKSRNDTQFTIRPEGTGGAPG